MITSREVCRNALDIYYNKKTCYAKGGIGWTLTEYRYNYLRNQYEANKTYLTPSDKGKCACDCSGMVVGMVYDHWRVDNEPTWSREHDWNDDGLHKRMYDKCSPDQAKPGMLLWKKGHVGLYVGNGLAMDSNIDKDGDGIHLRKVTDIKWAEAGKLPDVEYVDDIQPGDIIPMTVSSIEVGEMGTVAYGYYVIAPPVPKVITVGSKVTINPGARAGGLSNDPKTGRGVLIDPRYANGLYVDTVVEMATHYNVEEALLKGINTWVATSSLTLV